MKRSKQVEEEQQTAKRLKMTTTLGEVLPEIIETKIVPLLPKTDLFNFIVSCKKFYETYQQLLYKSLDFVRLYYLNYPSRFTNPSSDLEYQDLPHDVPMIGNILIPLLDKNLFDRPYLKGVNSDDLKELQAVSKYTPAQFEEKLLNSILHKQDAEVSVSEILLKKLFNWNRTSSEPQKFLVAGGCVTKAVISEGQPKERWSTDVDIFLMENGGKPSDSHRILQSVLLEFEQEATEAELDYGIVKNNGTLNIRSDNPSEPVIQFILRRVCNEEELMTFFDLDICRFAFNGKELVTIADGIRALYLKTNFVSEEHRYNGMYMKRAVKYGFRGYETSFFTPHPLQHLYTLKEVGDLCKNVPPKYSDNSGDGFTDKDEGLYTPLINITYERLHRICTDGIDTVILEEADVDDFEGDDFTYNARGCWNCFKQLNEYDPHTFALSASELFSGDLSCFYIDRYFDSHLRKKYLFFRCYLCGTYEHLPNKFSDELPKQPLKDAEPEYHMCAKCDAFNKSNVNLTRDLTDQVAIVTGARIKIGFEVSLKLLRAGAIVVATTRFVENAKLKFSAEPDWDTFKDRLDLYPLNLKDGKSILDFISYVSSNYDRIHILINNAAQTVRRPLLYYEKLINQEREALGLPDLDPIPQPQPSENNSIRYYSRTTNIWSSPQASLPVPVYQYRADLAKIESIEDPLLKAQHMSLYSTTSNNLTVEDTESSRTDFPKDKVDLFGEQLDLRKKHSWVYKLHQVSDVELLEVQMVNQIAPTILVSKLLDKMKTTLDDSETGYIINVTSHEGSFHTRGKTDNHIHTNMSKAALNMLTRSAAPYYAKHGIVMVSADTGWVSSAIETFKPPPLDCKDGAARIVYPIMTHSRSYGILLKNYKKVPW